MLTDGGPELSDPPDPHADRTAAIARAIATVVVGRFT
jgi:hypothetical protein